MDQEQAKGYTRLLYSIFGEKTDWEKSQPASDALIAQLDAVLGTLSVREDTFMRKRFGLENGEPQFLADLAKFLETSEEEAREFESETMRKLRHPSRSQPLRDYLD